jgi:DNA-binding FadR family transcriptional regulator
MLTVPGRIEASIEEHARIYDAIVRGDVNAAESAAYDHVCTVREQMGLDR